MTWKFLTCIVNLFKGILLSSYIYTCIGQVQSPKIYELEYDDILTLKWILPDKHN